MALVNAPVPGPYSSIVITRDQSMPCSRRLISQRDAGNEEPTMVGLFRNSAAATSRALRSLVPTEALEVG